MSEQEARSAASLHFWIYATKPWKRMRVDEPNRDGVVCAYCGVRYLDAEAMTGCSREAVPS